MGFKCGAQPNASSCAADDHQFVAFGVGDPPAILRLVEEPATGCEGRRDARLREVRRHSELEVDAVALPAPLRLRSVELLEHQHRVQPPRIVDVADPGSPVVGVSECSDPERADRGDIGGVEEELSEARQPRIRGGPQLAGSGLADVDWEGASLRGRTLEPIPFDGRTLGADLERIRPPIPEFTILSGMMVDRTDINHLLNLKRSWKSFVHASKILGRYGIDAQPCFVAGERE